MATYSTPRIKTFLADADLSGKQYHFVKIGSDNEHVTYCASAGRACGVLMNKPSGSGQVAEVALPGGGALLKLAGSVAAGNYLISNSSGAALIAAAAGQHVGAYAMEIGDALDVKGVEVVCFEAYEADS